MANRSALVRVPAARGEGTRVEVRFPDPSCNPYLAFAVMLRAGLDGIENSIEPPAPVFKNIHALTPEERALEGIGSLPSSLFEALEDLRRDPVMVDALGSHVLAHFVEAKTMEWEVYQSRVHQWEIDQYLQVF